MMYIKCRSRFLINLTNEYQMYIMFFIKFNKLYSCVELE